MLDVDELKKWLNQSAANIDVKLAQAYLFGSVLRYDKKVSDVDAVLIFGQWQVRKECILLRRMFRQAFGLPFHIQMFHVSQVKEISNFIKNAGMTRRVI